MSEQWSSTCQACGYALLAQAQICPKCGAPAWVAGSAGSLSGFFAPGSVEVDEPGGSSRAGVPDVEQVSERPLNIMLSLAPESPALGESLSAVEESLPVVEAGPRLMGTVPGMGESGLIADDSLAPTAAPGALQVSLVNTLLPQANPVTTAATAQNASDAGAVMSSTAMGQPGRGKNRRARWFSAPVIAGIALVLVLLFVLLFLTAKSTVAVGVIAPDWGLASLRIGLVATLLGGLLLLASLVLWREQTRPGSIYGSFFALLLVLVGVAGMLSAAPLHRLQGHWFEGQGQYGLALAAYQLGGDSLETSQDMVRSSIAWSEQLSARHDYSDAVMQLELVVTNYGANDILARTARLDLIQDYLAWGDQAQRQMAFSDALAHYQMLQGASYCVSTCQLQVHTHTAQALLGLAQQLTAQHHYGPAITAYQRLVQNYSDTPEGQEAEQALTAPQSVVGHLVYQDKSPAANFQILLASQWKFDSTTQVFMLLGIQYKAQTDATGRFVTPPVMVGNTYLIAWVDPGGHAGTCEAENNQPLYIVQALPLRVADVGTIDVDCV